MSIDFLTFKNNRIICHEENIFESTSLLEQAIQDIIDNDSILCSREIEVTVEYEPEELSCDELTTFRTISFIFMVKGEEIGRIQYATAYDKPDVIYKDNDYVYIFLFMELTKTCTDIATLEYRSPSELAISLEEQVIDSLEQYCFD